MYLLFRSLLYASQIIFDEVTSLDLDGAGGAKLINDHPEDAMILIHEMQFAQAIADQMFSWTRQIAEGDAHSFFTNPKTKERKNFKRI